jgi:hypothetical protein
MNFKEYKSIFNLMKNRYNLDLQICNQIHRILMISIFKLFFLEKKLIIIIIIFYLL